MRKTILFVLVVLIHFQVLEQKISFQGQLLENGLTVNGSNSFKFTMTIDGINWEENHRDIPATNGLYSVVIELINPLPKKLFKIASTHALTINIGGIALIPVTL